MASSLDVESRLADGQPAVDDVEDYVAACHRLGYQHPDLTAHTTQVQDWYAREAGLDLRALDADCAVLAAVASAAEDAARTQAGLVAEISGAWSGRGAAAAHEFTWRSGQAASVVSAAIRTAADAAATLRDVLWRAVDTKVAAVADIDARHQAQRAEWVAAAKTVTSGSGDLAAASELIDQQVKPFVANDIGTDWVAAMRDSDASINGAYDTARASTSAAPRAVFDVPGELGPRAETPERRGADDAAPPSPPVQTVPAAAAASTPAGATAPATAPATGALSVPPPPPVAAAPFWPDAASAAPPDPMAQAPTAPSGAMPSMSAPGSLGAGTSSLGTGLSGFGQQLADLIGGLVGSADLSDPTSLDDVVDEDVADPDDPDDLSDPDDREDPEGPHEPDDSEDPEDPNDPASPDDPAAEVTVPTGEEAPTCDGVITDERPPETPPEPTVVAPQPDPPAVPQSPPAAPVENAEPTPCEIAADELPQVGE